MLMSEEERKSEREAKTLIQKKKERERKGKVNMAGGLGLLLFPEERINGFDNLLLHNVCTIRRVQHGHRVL